MKLRKRKMKKKKHLLLGVLAATTALTLCLRQ
jgi:hypothetical protein